MEDFKASKIKKELQNELLNAQKIDEKNFMELFRKLSNNHPDVIAVVSENETITYFELNGQPDNLAKYLKKKWSAHRGSSRSLFSLRY